MAESTTEQAKETVQQAASQAKDQAQQAAGQARGRAKQEIDTRTTDAGQRVHGTANDMRSVAETLREQGKEQPAKLAEKAAERAERIGGYLEQSDADRILNDVEDFARRQPWVVGLGAAALGFAAARFLKASSSQRYESRSGAYGGYGGRYSDYGRGYQGYRSPEPTGSLTTGPDYPTSGETRPGNGGNVGSSVPGVGLGGSPSTGV